MTILRAKLLRRTTLVFVILAALIVTACAPATPAPQPTAAAQSTLSTQPVSLKVVILPFISFAPYWIAQDNGYFKEQGLEVEFVDMTNQQDTLPAMLGGQVDVTSGQVYAAMFNAAAKDSPVKIVADKGYINPESCENIAVIGRKDAFDAGDLKAEQLQGKRMTLVAGSWNEYYLESCSRRSI